jgi:site-specific recombinase XerD
MMIGPLTVYEAVVREGMARRGYAQTSIREAIGLMARLSGWMDTRGIGVLSSAAVEQFVAERRDLCQESRTARRWVGAVTRELLGCGAMTSQEASGDAVTKVLTGYREFLRAERSLSAESVRCYLTQGRKFLAHLPDPLPASLARLDAGVVTAFVLENATAAGSVWSAKTLVNALRSLLRYLYLHGLAPGPLAAAVPAVAGWRLAALPRALPADQVRLLLQAPVRLGGVGVRDRAVLLLAGLGLRGAEVAGLRLDEIAWQAGQITVVGKAARREALPLAAEVGEAMADYLEHARPRCVVPTLFVAARAPCRPLSPTCIRAIMARACTRAGLPRLGAHRLRHSLATEMLRAGAGLPEVGQVLRHRSMPSTAVYAKVDDAALRGVAMPWPGSAA